MGVGLNLLGWLPGGAMGARVVEPVRGRVRVRESVRCPLCFEGIEQAARERCTGCRTRFHTECLEELGGCSTLGCGAWAPARARFARELEPPEWEQVGFQLKVLLSLGLWVGAVVFFVLIGLPPLAGAVIGSQFGALLSVFILFGKHFPQ